MLSCRLLFSPYLVVVSIEYMMFILSNDELKCCQKLKSESKRVASN